MNEMKSIEFVFRNASIGDWLRDISYLRNNVDTDSVETIVLSFRGFHESLLKPEHIASFACLLECWYNKGFRDLHIDRDTSIGNYLWNVIGIKEYWAGQQNFTEAEKHNVLNLWRVVDQEKEIHGRRVKEYLKNVFFRNKDLSAVENSLTEAYYNVFDHANADGNAFTMMQFDEERSVLHVAICDFGIGIAKSVQNFLKCKISDTEAINKAIEANFTVRSASYNAGQGLSNILSSCTEDDVFCIYSNAAVLTQQGDRRTFDELKFSFDGTLLYYSMSLSHFEDEETISEFEW